MLSRTLNLALTLTLDSRLLTILAHTHHLLTLTLDSRYSYYLLTPTPLPLTHSLIQHDVRHGDELRGAAAARRAGHTSA